MFDPYLLRRAIIVLFNNVIGARLMFVTAASTALFLMLVIALTLTPTHLSQSTLNKFWPKDTVDDYSFASITALQLQAKSGSPRVLLVGTAALREGLELPTEIVQKLNQLGTDKVEVVNFMTGGQSAIEAAALVGEVIQRLS